MDLERLAKAALDQRKDYPKSEAGAPDPSSDLGIFPISVLNYLDKIIQGGARRIILEVFSKQIQ